MRRLTTITMLGLALALGLAACGSDDASDSTSLPAATDVMPPVPTETAAVPSSAADDPCALVEDSELATLFAAAGAPESESNVLGEGFGECVWEGDNAHLSVSIVPEENFQSDFVDQLNVSGPVESAALGDTAVSFPGVVGIGRAEGGGTSVGFSKDDTGVIVAVRTGTEGNPGADLALATKVAESIAAQL